MVCVVISGLFFLKKKTFIMSCIHVQHQLGVEPLMTDREGGGSE